MRAEILSLGAVRNPDAKERRYNEREFQFHTRLLDGTLSGEITKKGYGCQAIRAGCFGRLP